MLRNTFKRKKPSNITITTPGDREILISRTFAAPRERVFAAFTEPELIRRWMTGPAGWTMEVCDVDLRVGGTYRYVWRGPKEAEIGMGGTFNRVEAPERLDTTELFDEDWTGGATQCSLVLTEKEGKTLSEQRVVYSSAEARDQVMKSNMEAGLGASYDRLAAMLRNSNQ